VIVNPSSPLRRIPAALERRQQLVLDGVRYSIEMADLAHSRLRACLDVLSRPIKADQRMLTSAFLDAWSIVDSVHRLTKLLRHVRGLKQKSPVLELFYRNAAQVEQLRHIVQHMDGQENLEPGTPIWGVLGWAAMDSSDLRAIRSCMLIAGAIVQAEEHPFVNPGGQTIMPPVDLITLSIDRTKACLSDQLRRIEPVAREVEAVVAAYAAGDNTLGADAVVVMELSFDPAAEGAKFDGDDRLGLNVKQGPASPGAVQK
jgi:hypothetical protein